MERNGDFGPSILTCNFFMDHVGEVSATLNPDGLSWKLMDSLCNDGDDHSTCLGIQIVSKHDTSINISDVYAVEFIDWGLVHETFLTNPECLSGHSSEMYRFTVHGVERSKSQPSLWAPTVYTFGNVDKETCQTWVNRMNTYLSMETDRPKSLLVYVNPGSGKGNSRRTWESVSPIFSQAKVKTKVIVTEKAGHAFEAMASMANRDLNSYDGVVAVGGDGFFNEILNGILLSRHRAPYPPSPSDDDQTVESESDVLLHDPTVTIVEPLVSNEDESPFLSRSPLQESQAIMSFPNERFRFGLIPDAIVICTTGVRDPMTSALQIIMGKRVCLDNQVLEQLIQRKQQQQQPQPHSFEIPSSTTQKHKKTCKKVAWSDDEYKLLAEMWIHISEDQKVGNAQPGNAFWNRIQNDYNMVAQQSSFPQRNKDQLTSKWRNMNVSIKLFNGFYGECTRIRGSGTSDEQMLASALSMYTAETNHSFIYIKAWYVLKDHPKWKNLKDVPSSSKRLIDVDDGKPINLDDDTQKDIFGDDTIQRPPEKSKNKSQKSSFASGTAQEQASAFCVSLLDQLKKITKTKKLTAKTKKEVFKAQKQALEAQKQASEAQKQASDAQTRKYDFAFLAMSTENMTETDAAFIDAEKNRIRIKYDIM